MYKITFSNRFKKCYKHCIKQGLKPEKMADAIRALAETGTVPQKYLPHPLYGDYNGCMECHLQPDWLLIWKKQQYDLEIIMVTTGSHSELFGKKRR